MTDFSKLGLKRSITAYQDSDGALHPVQVADNKPRNISEPLYYQISAGNIPGQRNFIIYSSVASADDTEKDMSNLGVDQVPLPATAFNFQIVSTSSLDAAGEDGVNMVLVNGLDSNFDEVLETHSMNGLTPVTITTSMIRINFIDVTSIGDNVTNQGAAGDISIQNSADGTTYAKVDSGDTRINQLYFTVPRSHAAFLVQYGVGGIAGNTTTEGRIRLKTTACPCSREINRDLFFIETATDFHDGQINDNFTIPLMVPPKGSFKLTVQRAGGASTIIANGHISFWIQEA